MQLYAMSTGNFLSGALIMGTFAVGTTPGLLGIGGLTSILKGASAKKFFKFAGILVAALALFNISNGLNLTGWRPSFNKNIPVQQTLSDPNVTIENGVQIVKMNQLAGAYEPNQFTIKKGIPVKWIINAKKPDSCSASILAPKIGVKKFLELGENIIEFTPKDTGEIKFSCIMGMYTGSFNVIN
jgi:plastocyanin